MAVLKYHLQAEMWRLVEEAEGKPRRDPAIEATARVAGEIFQNRVRARAARFLATNGGVSSLDRFSARLRAATTGLIALSLIAGLGITRIFPNDDGAAVNVMAVLGALILPNLLSLFLWLLVSFAGAISAGVKSGTCMKLGMSPKLVSPKLGTSTVWATGWLGARYAHAVQFLQRRGAFPSPAEARAWAGFLLHTAAGRARLACQTQCLWLGLMLGSLTGCWAWFAFKQVDFQWGSTVLTESTVERVLTQLARPLSLLGIAVPSAQEVSLTRLGQTGTLPAATRRHWGYFILAALVVYGLLPRALAASFTWALMKAQEKHLELDEAQPGYARLRSFLMPPPASTIVDAAGPLPAEFRIGIGDGFEIRPRHLVRPVAAAWLALERASLPTFEPLQNLGVIADRQTQRQMLDIAQATHTWPALVVQVALVTTPDRGLERFLAALTAAVHCPLYLQLVDAPEASEWNSVDRAQRIEDWTALALKAGLPPANIFALTT